MKKINWGILSTASIGVENVIPAMQKGEYSKVQAIASRDMEKAKNIASKLNIQKSYGSYQELINDKEIEAVYIPLPNHMHVDWTINSLEAGKHVLCEKPISMDAAEAQKLLKVSSEYPNLKVMEAFMYRFHPQWQKAKQIVSSGKIGDLKNIQSFFSYFDDDPASIGNKVELGGGGLMDIGCYNISLSRFLFDREPERVFGVFDYDPRFNVDRHASAILDFGKGTSTFTCSTQLSEYQHVNILGTRGKVQIQAPFIASPDKKCKIWHQTESEVEEIIFDPCDQYSIQGDLFSRAILNDIDVPTPLEDAMANMIVIEAIKKSAASGKWQHVGAPHAGPGPWLNYYSQKGPM